MSQGVNHAEALSKRPYLAVSLSESAQGRLRLESFGNEDGAQGEPDKQNALQADVAQSIRDAFNAGDGHGVLQLAALATDVRLPASLSYWRRVGQLFVTCLCAQPQLEESRDAVDVAVSPQLAELALAVPPQMRGADNVDEAMLRALWRRMLLAYRSEVRAFAGSVEAYLHGKNPTWNLLGKVCFHLAENRANARQPFAFLATVSEEFSQAKGVRHVPLGQALRAYAGKRNAAALSRLLQPVQRAASKSTLVHGLLASKALFQPQAWTPEQAYGFLKDVPLYEASGIKVRLPDWWRKRGVRAKIGVTVGSSVPSVLGTDALLDFKLQASLDGVPLTAKEWKSLAAGTAGLVLLRGHWVEVDPDKLQQALTHWEQLQAAYAEGVTFVEGMRLLAGASLGSGERAAEHETAAAWSDVTAGPWLREALQSLTQPGELQVPATLLATLRPYQRIGLQWLWRLQQLGLGGCLADDMGLGKTMQIIAVLLQLKKAQPAPCALLIVPATLLGNWQQELMRFAPSLTLAVVHPAGSIASPASQLPTCCDGIDLTITTYGMLQRHPWLQAQRWNLVVLDEAQAIKNPASKQTRAVKVLRSHCRVALTGTPVENRLSDLWSLFDFLNPGLLGGPKAFARQVKALESPEGPGYAPLRALLQPYLLRRLKTDKKIIADLPDKTEVNAWCHLSKRQAVLYQQAVDALAERLATAEGMQRRGVILAFLMRFKQICNHPSQWLGDGRYEPADSGKFVRLAELCDAVVARREKVLVFTQFRELTEPLARFLEQVFGRPGLVLHGGTPVKQRRAMVEAFQSDGDVPFFVLSLKAGGTGLNLTAANHVVHFDRWWNPAVENQATDRVFRIGQHRNVLVHKFVCRGTLEENVDKLITHKQRMSTDVLKGEGDTMLTEMNNDELLRTLSLDLAATLADE